MKVKLCYTKSLLLLFAVLLGLSSCSKEDDAKLLEPQITLDSKEGTYMVKVGKSITITPTYENVDGAIYAWKLDGKVISNDPTITFSSNEVGQYYLSLIVITNAGEVFKDVTVTVASLVPPTISMIVPEDGFKIIKGGVLAFKPTVQGDSTSTKFDWTVNGSSSASTKSYNFSQSTVGTYTVKLATSNEDGKDELSFKVQVCNASDLPFSWTFDQTECNMSLGRTIRIKAWDIVNDFGGTYTWSVDGTQKQTGSQTYYLFTGSSVGKHKVTVKMKNTYTEESQDIIVNVCPAEGTYQRPVTASSNKLSNKVYEFMAAPGQFTNQGYTATTMEKAVEYATRRLGQEAYVSLGGYGGYLVVGFDHSVVNDGSYNLEILGNSFAGSSEPGIVYVMQDENGNGLPDDTWYELAGSETAKGNVIYDYSITYYKPSAPGMNTQWKDNQGNTGTVDYNNFHRQDYYYPSWAPKNTLTFHGTCLPANSKETSPGYWYNTEYEWGYVDNFSPIDRLTTDINYGAAANGNHFRISDAIDYKGNHVSLKYIDFVKVATSVNSKAGWLGEVSTEVFQVRDFNIIKSQVKSNRGR